MLTLSRKVLVTGANGFVGESLCRRLSAEKFDVVRITRQVKDDAVAVGDIDGTTDWRNVLAGVKIIIHAAARVPMMQDPPNVSLAEYRKVNVDGTMNLARQAADVGVRRFVYISTIKVNGDDTVPGHFFNEEVVTVPVEPYALSKYVTEVKLRELAKQTGLEVVIIRPPLIYGTEVKANFLGMMEWVERGVPLPLGSLHNQRSLIFVDNLVDFITTCINHPAAAQQTFVISDGDDLSTTDLLRRTAAVMGVPARLFPVPLSLLMLGATMFGKRAVYRRLCGNLQVDITKARTLLGWTPPVSVDEGLRRTAVWYLEKQGKGGA